MSHHPDFRKLEASRPEFKVDSFTTTKSPNPSWLPGTGLSSSTTLPGVKEGLWKAGSEFKKIDPSITAGPSLYKMMISAITPRPIAFLSSVSAEGINNLAPFSYFNLVGHNPPMLMVSFTHPSAAQQKDSCANIKATKNFTINMISEPFVEAANYTCVDAPANVDEWELSGLTKLASTIVNAPRVAESAFSMECELELVYDMFDPKDATQLTSTMILGRVKMFHARSDIISDDLLVNTRALQPVSRLGGISYGRTTELYETPRPLWKVEVEREEVKKIMGTD